MEDSYRKALNKKLIFGVILSLLLVVGIPCIPIGFSSGLIPVGVIGIVFAVLGFYGSPLVWTNYGTARSYYGIYCMITEDGITDIDRLAATLSISQKKALSQVNYLINKRYLRGYVLEGMKLVSYAPEKKTTDSGKCPNCGATLVPGDGVLYCPYCGGKFPLK